MKQGARNLPNHSEFAVNQCLRTYEIETTINLTPERRCPVLASNFHIDFRLNATEFGHVSICFIIDRFEFVDDARWTIVFGNQNMASIVSQTNAQASRDGLSGNS